ncbi:hypothetical protein F5Y19DRAFT_482515 [Xylariaceae sp. FL1651]|nr:hypothetical protein F5Y19DRAFT_482515 [Xylariaceae sp. FL1651]
MTKFDQKDTTYRLIVEELSKLTATPITQIFSFESNTTEMPLPKLSHLRTSLEFVINILKDPLWILPGLEALSLELQETLIESQILLKVAEDILCRATIKKNEAQFIDIAMVIRDEIRALESALNTAETPLRSHKFTNQSVGVACLHPLLQSSLRCNSHLKTILLEEFLSSLTLEPGFRRNKTALNELLSLRYALDVTFASGTPGRLEPEWIASERLYFPAEPELEIDHEKESWLEKFARFFTEPESSDLKLKPRRFAALRTGDKFEKVMVEFCLCTEHMSPIELSFRRQRLVNTARTILQSNLSTATRLSTVPLRGISSIATATTHSLLMVFRADALVGLDEAFDKFDIPTVKSRVWLALRYAESIAALHSACFCHGLINPSNLYLQVRASLRDRYPVLQAQNMSPMVAGFDIARQTEWSSDLIDVEEPHWRIHLHPERMQRGYNKERQDPRHDIFSFGMVMIELGLWKLFSRFQNYKSAETEAKRQDYCIKLRKKFQGDGTDGEMPDDYRDIISYCLGRSSFLPGEALNAQQSRLLSELDEPKATRVVDALSRLYERLPLSDFSIIG